MDTPIKGEERVASVHDFEDVCNTNTIIEKTNMTIDASKTQRIAMYYAPDSTVNNRGKWIEKTIYKNSSSETIGVKNTYSGVMKPSWVPTTLL